MSGLQTPEVGLVVIVERQSVTQRKAFGQLEVLWYCGAIGFFVTAALSRIVEACAMGFSHSKVQTIDDTFPSKASMESDSALGFFGNVDLEALIAFTEHCPN